jgi:hypothetical protein
LAEKGIAWAATARDAVEWFALRRTAKFSGVDLQRKMISVSLEERRSLPGLRLRLYNLPASDAGPSADIPFSTNLVLAG